MTNLNAKTVMLCAGLTMAGSTQANLIINGGFENENVRDGGWRWFNSANVDGWGGSNIEIWDSLGRVEAYEGKQHAELNAHKGGKNYSIFQNFATNAGQEYEVSFAYRARRNNNEAFRFGLSNSDTSSIISQNISDHTRAGWSLFTTRFNAGSDLTTLFFSTITKGTKGNFLDDVKVVATNVPEPSSLALVALGLLGLSLSRKNAKR